MGDSRVRVRTRRCPLLLTSRIVHQVPTKAIDSCVHHPIVSPPKQRIPEPRCQPHRPLHHLDRPHREHARLRGIPYQLEPGDALEITTNRRLNTTCGHAFVQHHIKPHSIRKGRHDHAMQCGARLQAHALHGKLAQPRPPQAEAVEPPHRSPQLLRRDGKRERVLVLDHTGGTRHDRHDTPAATTRRSESRASPDAPRAAKNLCRQSILSPRVTVRRHTSDSVRAVPVRTTRCLRGPPGMRAYREGSADTAPPFGFLPGILQPPPSSGR